MSGKTPLPNTQNLLVKFCLSENCIILTTCGKKSDRRHSDTRHFYIDCESFQVWFAQMRESGNKALFAFAEEDNGNILQARLCGNEVAFRIAWLRFNESCIYGEKFQNFRIHAANLEALLEHGAPFRELHGDSPENVKIDGIAAASTLRKILQDPCKRRAFSKAMRDQLRWRGDTIRLYNDFVDSSFYFQASCGICGGLILHEGTIHTPHGEFPRLYYSVHT